MWAIDTEATSVWLQGENPASVYALGIYDGSSQRLWDLDIDPETRKTKEQLPSKVKKEIRSHLYEAPTIFQNQNFDLKALCTLGVIDWTEPEDPRFWDNIVELSHLSHLYDSRDSEFKGSLKDLAKLYLPGFDYQSQTDLHSLVNRCRNFCRNRVKSYKIANEVTVPQATKDWIPMDMWLPAALYRHYPDQEELKDYFEDKYPLLNTIMCSYLSDDCYCTWELGARYFTELSERHDNLEELLQMNRQLSPVLWSMETRGIRVHKNKVTEGIEKCHEWKSRLLKRCQNTSQVNNFGKDYTASNLRSILFTNFKLEPVAFTKKSKEAQVDTKAILKLKEQAKEIGNHKADKFLTNLLAARKYDKKGGTLVGYKRLTSHSSCIELPEVNTNYYCIFPSLKETGTGTTRFASYNPNSQNMEKATDPFAEELPEIARLLAESP